MGQIAQNTTPSGPAPAVNNTAIENIAVSTLAFETIRQESSLAVVIKEPFEKCALIVKDETGHIIRNQDVWFKDKEQNVRQVIDANPQEKYTYRITFTKSGEPQTTITGNFPDLVK